MTRAVKAVSTYRGRDPRDFALCAFGGNGPVVGVEIARALSMRQVIVPPAPGVFSAVGLLFSQTEQEFVRTLLLRAGEIDEDAVDCGVRVARRGGPSRLSPTKGSHPTPVTFVRLADLRYAGQAYELTVRVPDGPVDVHASCERLSSPSTCGHTVTGRPTTRRPRLGPDPARVDRATTRGRLTPSQHGTVAAPGKAVRGARTSVPSRASRRSRAIGESSAPRRRDSRGRCSSTSTTRRLSSRPAARATLDAFGSIEIDVD